MMYLLVCAVIVAWVVFETGFRSFLSIAARNTSSHDQP